MSLITSALMQGMIYAPLALGVFIAFRVLKISDLTLDGSLVFGMTVCAVVTIAGHPVLAIFSGMIAGALAGLITGLLQTKLRIDPMLSGILTMTALYTVNFAVLGGQANRYLQTGNETSNTIFKMAQSALSPILGNVKNIYIVPLIVLTLINVLLCAALAVFFKTRTGLFIRAVGDNEDMVRSSSINADAVRIVGIMLSNALVALSGALLCQQQKYADLNCGTGMLVAGLAAVIIGKVIFGDRGITVSMISAIVGSLIYRIIIQAAYKIDMPSYFVKAISAVIVIAALSVPTVRTKLGMARARRARKWEANV